MTKEFNPIRERDSVKDIRDMDVKFDEYEFDDVIGFFETVDTVPTKAPTRISQQIKIYKSGSARRLYWYDSKNQEWVYEGGTPA